MAGVQTASTHTSPPYTRAPPPGQVATCTGCTFCCPLRFLIRPRTVLASVRVARHKEFSERVLCLWTVKMVRSLSQWTKTLSFPARLSPNRTSKESVGNGPSSPGVSPTPSASSLPQSSDKTITPIPITEISQIVSFPFLIRHLNRSFRWIIS